MQVVYNIPMSIFKSLALRWWQTSLFKISAISFGIILGVYFHDFFLQWIVLVTVACVVFGIYIASIWWEQ
jgi:hypothetical protein